LWQRALCEGLGLNGRILISKHGINGTVGGPIDKVKKYVRVTRSYPAFKSMEFKWSDGGKDDFPDLQIKVRDEIVTFGVPDEIIVDENGVVGGGVHLKPEEVNALVAKRDDVVFFDGRNAFEAKIGKFRDAIVPQTETTRDFIAELESGKYDHIKDKPIITYCTGGIRCEVLSVIMKNRGFKEIYQIDGGIVRYGEKYRDRGLWEGSLYVFDARLNVEFSPSASVIGECDYCHSATSQFHNCELSDCRKRILLCAACTEKHPIPRCPSHAASVTQ
jgi:UPF0176 protein